MELRSKLLNSFEIIVRTTLAFTRSSYVPVLKWSGEKELLAEIFVSLRNLTNKNGKNLLENSYEDIAVFLKANFNAYENTGLSTIQGTLRRLSSQKERSKVKIDITK